jgi:hypothetical protein
MIFWLLLLGRMTIREFGVIDFGAMSKNLRIET